MKKRFLALTMILCMTVALLAGCGGKSKSNEAVESVGTTGETKSTEKEKTEEKTVLTFMAVGGSNEQAFVDVISAAADKFNADNKFNAEIKLDWYENEQYKTKLATLMTQNDVTDIFFTWEAGFMEDYVESGNVYSLSDALGADAEWSARFNNGVFDAVTFDNKVYAVPMGQAIIPVYYNKALFKANGVEVPVTWEDLMAAVHTFTAAGIVPISMATQDAWVSGQMMQEIAGGIGGKEFYNDIVAGKAPWNDERYIEAGKAFQELVNASAFPEGFLGLGYDEGRSIFTSGKAAMYPMGIWDTSAVLSGMANKDDVGVFLLPTKKPEYKNVHIACIEKLFAISEKCKDKEAALAFLKLLSDPEIQKMYVLNCGAVPATNVEVDKSQIDAVTSDVLEMLKDIEPINPIARVFNVDLAGEFNNSALSIAAGTDPSEQLETLQNYAEKIKGQ